ncbi:hypothetical protein [Nostoc sp. C110]|uniref:hypothetical protein n=1 Tax=Nostoc sp. C110 TaxID=3349876 RepID=UPI00370DAF2C
MQIIRFNVVLQKLLSRRDWDCYLGVFSVLGADKDYERFPQMSEAAIYAVYAVMTRIMLRCSAV